ncbi:hypothetical protein LZ554_001343 [Drepanopeziza brunnea f. sp. 'monogermtubi']|nr:hypothetical protein LZ554_001343 [Drepanopeziza brunnea f. sp. 'monogermtubi']
MPPAIRIRPYKDFLTPALHKRFALATTMLFALCYVEAVLIGEKNSYFWTWFPFGRAGIRSGLLFVPSFSIFILRVGQLHVGIRTSYSAFSTFVRYITRARSQVLQTVGWYVFSAWLFSEIYIWSASMDQDLSRAKTIQRTDRQALNEKPIYLTFSLMFLGFVQAGFHLWYDYDRIDMPATKTNLVEINGEQQEIIVPETARLRAKLPSIIATAVKRSFALTLLSPIVYSLDLGFLPSFRTIGWRLGRFIVRTYYNLPRSSSLPTTRPFHLSLLKNTFTSGFLIVMLWEVGNAAFSIYVAQEPLKHDRPITYESRDPNGSLLTGLKGKKLQTRAFAFWELVYIAARFEGRRKAIYEDIDRAGGSAWSQILDACLGVINGIEIRIANYGRPSSDAPPDPCRTPEPPTPGLPRLSQPPRDGLKESGDLFTRSRGSSAAGKIKDYARSQGQSPLGPASAKAKKALAIAEKVLIPKEEEPGRPSFSGMFKELALRILKTQVGVPFRQEYRRKISAVVLGEPFGDIGIIVDAIDAVTRFSVCSLREDKFGNVQRDVSLIIRTLTSTVTRLEAFKANLGFHWTDIEKKQESPEVDIVLAALKRGLNELVIAFGDYSSDLGLSQNEMRMAIQATTPAAEKPEMATI